MDAPASRKRFSKLALPSVFDRLVCPAFSEARTLRTRRGTAAKFQQIYEMYAQASSRPSADSSHQRLEVRTSGTHYFILATRIGAITSLHHRVYHCESPISTFFFRFLYFMQFHSTKVPLHVFFQSYTFVSSLPNGQRHCKRT